MTDGDTGRSLSIEEGASLLADMFEPQKTPEDDPQVESAEDDPPEETPEDDAVEEEIVEEAEEADDTDESGPELTTLEQVAEALQKSPDELLKQLKTTVTVNGKSSEVTLAELQAGYQRGRDYSEKTTALKQQRESYERESTAQKQYLEDQLLQMGQVVQTAEQLFLQPPDVGYMNQLRQTNPAEWSARLQEFQARSGVVNQLKQATMQSIQQFRQQADQAQQAARAQRLEAERPKLEAIPGWGEEMRSNLVNYLKTQYERSDDDLSSISESWIVDLTRKGMLYDKLQAESSVAAKKVKAMPKLVPPSKPNGRPQQKRSAIEQAKAHLRKTGSRDAAAAVIERLL
jgi:hypothetical protein